MKRVLIFSLAFTGSICSGPAFAQKANIDSVAVLILDKMSALMSELHSCKVDVHTEYDVSNQMLGLVKHSDDDHVFLSGANKLFVDAAGDKGAKNYIYNGRTFTFYSEDKNHYAQTDLNTGTVAMIDTMNKLYGIVFPAADFLYPAFVDDILSEATALVLLGVTKVNGKDCYHIAGSAKDKTYQFWIAEGPFCLPLKMVINYSDKPLNPQFEAQYTNWELNTILPDGIFEFKVPPGAKKIKFTPLNEKKSTKK